MSEFEESFSEKGIELYVLPPRSPKYNGGVERSYRIFREEFYTIRRLTGDSIGEMRFEKKSSDKLVIVDLIRLVIIVQLS